MMGSNHIDRFETIAHAQYHPQNLFRIVTDEQTEVVLSNGGFAVENPTLQLFGYFGVRPSTFEQELLGMPLPLVGDSVSPIVFENGKWVLQDRAEWIGRDDE